MSKTICSIEDCSKTVVSRGWCTTHYKRWTKHGSPLTVLARPGRRPCPEPSTPCVGPECPNMVGAQSKTGLCRTHRAQIHRGAAELTPIQPWSRGDSFPATCTVPGCDRPHGGKGMCNAHRNRDLKGLSVSEPIRPSVRRFGCLVEDCEEAHTSRGYCKRHYGLIVSRFRLYGITRERADELLAAQGGRCAVCNQAFPLTALAIDHDHNCCPKGRSCGACVRGLLCGLCNLGLGSFRDDVESLTRAIDYLRRTRVETH